MKKIIMLVWLLLVTGAAFAQKTDLKYNLERGKEYFQTTTTKMDMTQSVMGMDMKMEMNMTMVMSFKVKAVNAGIYDLEVGYKKIFNEVVSQFGGTVIDSDSPNNNDISSLMISELTKNSFTMKMDSKGNVLEVTGLDRMINAISSQISEKYPGFSASDLKAVKSQLEGTYNAEQFKNNFSNSTAVFPDKPVAAGDKWTVDGSVNTQGMNLDMVTEYEYRGKEGNFWKLGAVGDIMTPEGAVMEAEGMVMALNIAGKFTGEYKIDSRTGWISTADSGQNMQGEFSMEVPGQGTMNVGMKITASTTVSDKR